MWPLVCKDGAGHWRILTLQTLIWATVFAYSVFLTDTEVSWKFKSRSYLLTFYLGQEVALYVKKHYCKILSNLPSFKAKNYKLALEESFLKIDE